MSAPSSAALRVLHVTTVHRPLDTRIFYKEVRSLSHSGFDVRLATTVSRPETHDGIAFLPLGTREGPRLRRIWRDVRALLTMLSNRDAIVHIHDPELLVVAAVPAALGARVVYDVHEFYAERIAGSTWIPAPIRGGLAGLYEAIERLVLPHFAGVVVVSEAMKPRYEHLLPPSRVALVRNFPNVDESALRNARARPHPLGGRPYALHTGGAMRLRAFHDVVAAGERLHHRGSPLALVNLGDVDLSDYSDGADLLVRAERAGIVMTGSVGYTDALTWLAHARIGYLPLVATENNRRGMPNKLFEYLLFGLPVVASDIGRVADIVSETGAGVLVPIDAGARHGDALAAMHEDETEYARFSAAARRASSTYSFDGEFVRLRELYAEIAAEGVTS